ncbi:metallophosphoesterase [Nostoc sp. NMS4]|uniref:metallophosphoesterase family protein n=1 Tax=Nostoc sp. NMS4 TaxID=2815390 RepID=UPI0025FB6ABA|nr:metallophosphoesterase [Nostoc sp. NMS4]MBN3921732.1 metallophosphoesterase [Nostoc sp. NMS4]
MRRRNFIEHVAWTGLGILWAVGENGLLTSCSVGDSQAQKLAISTPLSFVQISDTHLGFNKEANPHVTASLQQAINAINSLPTPPAFIVHTGDITHLSKPEEFDTAKQLLSKLKAPLFTLPGEHDTIGDRGKAYGETFSQKDKREGLQTWDYNGVHLISLTNVLEFGETGQGKLGQSQLDLLEKDLTAQKRNTPIVIFSHIPLYNLYPQWGWATADSGKVLALLSRFSSVTVLSGHIHQVIQHSEGNIRFSTAASVSYPLPAPGKAEKPAPVKLPEKDLLAVLGFRTLEFVPANDVKIDQHSLA